MSYQSLNDTEKLWAALFMGVLTVVFLLGVAVVKAGISFGVFITSGLMFILLTVGFVILVYNSTEALRLWSVYAFFMTLCLIPVLSETGTRELAPGANPITAMFSDVDMFVYYAEARWYAKWYWQCLMALVALMLEPARMLITAR